ncbi:hypothetical protein HETIRDRAFT_322819 [Heterobasidion irregulare TC 32-1]|uniref:Uncharacterized protein n=1 Tax=Heterobasidion irregulare (strain TC 32-1) TaxID=747525 RepID=W4K170_HETIT|nr:uncharacterized protein HETIRDRAFT_322819 [Heterobasidion irregulare TC 32-1]ETW79469.1 hypothetical protein HETIRDRAFT_322819 [Heterobasidion irregulare TC 32-1]
MIGSIWAQNTTAEHCVAEVDFAWVAQIVNIPLARVAHSVGHHENGAGALHIVGAVHTVGVDYMVVAKDGRRVHDRRE